MMVAKRWFVGCLVVLSSSAAQAQISFRQGGFDTAIPAFGGYNPSSAGRAAFSNQSRALSFRQGSFDATLPPFGGYSPNSGARLSFSNRGPAMLRQGTANGTLPPFGGFTPNAVARLQNRPAQAAQIAPVPAARPAIQAVEPVANGTNQAANVQQTRRSRAIAKLVQKAEAAAAAQRIGQARMYYRMALKRATPETEAAILAGIDALP